MQTHIVHIATLSSAFFTETTSAVKKNPKTDRSLKEIDINVKEILPSGVYRKTVCAWEQRCISYTSMSVNVNF